MIPVTNLYQSYNPSMSESSPSLPRPLILLPMPKSRIQVLREKCSEYKELIKEVRAKIDSLENEIKFWTSIGTATCLKYKKADRELAELDGRLKRQEKVVIKKRTKDELKQFNQDQLQQLIVALEQTIKRRN